MDEDERVDLDEIESPPMDHTAERLAFLHWPRHTIC